jgi:hypothetical protein
LFSELCFAVSVEQVGKEGPACFPTNETFLHYYETNKEAVDQTDAEKLWSAPVTQARFEDQVAPLQLVRNGSNRWFRFHKRS